MNEKLQYAEMLEIPVSTCNITYKPPRKRLLRRRNKVNADEIKAELIDKVNSQTDGAETAAGVEEKVAAASSSDEKELQDGQEIFVENPEKASEQSITVNIRQAEPKRKERKRFSVIAVQLCIIGVLIATIFLTNAIFEGSGINTFFKGVFGSEQTSSADVREYSEFAPVISKSNGILSVEDGVITTDFVGSMYSPCDGKVTKIVKDADGGFTLEIYHSENFKTVIEGLEFVYAEEGGEVKANIPVGYVKDKGATLCFYNGASQITNFTVAENTVVWAV